MGVSWIRRSPDTCVPAGKRARKYFTGRRKVITGDPKSCLRQSGRYGRFRFEQIPNRAQFDFADLRGIRKSDDIACHQFAAERNKYAHSFGNPAAEFRRHGVSKSFAQSDWNGNIYNFMHMKAFAIYDLQLTIND